MSGSGYFDLYSTGSTFAVIYDATAGSYLYGNSYQSNVYVNSTHANYLYVVGYATSENYCVTMMPSIDGNSADLNNSKYICPEYSGYQTASGHTDYYGDLDSCSLWLAGSGYYDLTSTGSTFSLIFDATAGTYLYGNSYQSNLYLDATHINYLYVAGYTTGENYSVTVKPHS